MTQRTGGTDAPISVSRNAGGNEPFGGGQLWIGQHSGDGDILVFDPKESDALGDVIVLYSLSQHRTRSFPRATVTARIQAVTDELSFARAKKDYAQRATLRAAHEEGLAEELSSRKDQQRDGVLAAHRRYIEGIGFEYQGERETGANHKSGRRTKCHACGIALDDFAGAVCVICQGVLCSCGACACGNPAHAR